MRHLFIAMLLGCISCQLSAQDNYKEVSLPQLMKKTQEGGKKYIILDVRSTSEYMDTAQGGKSVGIGRIKTAINIPIQDLLQKPEAIKQLEQYKNDDIYVICSHSYRSRRISNLLLQNGFTSVNNVRGGMSEWYRNYDELQPYAAVMYENNIPYHNMAPSQLFKKLKAGEKVEIIGFMNPPRFYFDSIVAPLYDYFPEFKKMTYYKASDSLQVLEKVKAGGGKTFVLFNAVGGGAADIAEWLAKKGYTNTYNLIGNLAGFFEYLANYQPAALASSNYMQAKSKLAFFTPLSFCNNPPANAQWVDIRHDTSFAKAIHGTKLDYRTLKGAASFPYYKNADDFAKQFPDKSKLYILIPEEGYKGIELADALLKKGYNTGWLLSGIERWEWYTNNIPEFKCGDYLIK